MAIFHQVGPLVIRLIARQKACNAACAIAALFNFASIGIKNAIENIVRFRMGWFQPQQLIKTDSGTAITYSANECGIEMRRSFSAHDDEVIAKRVHFYKRDTHFLINQK
jgi:hypothetical protein